MYSQFSQQSLRINGLQSVGTEGADSDRTEVGIPHHDRVGRAPLQVSNLSSADEVDLRLERAVEPILPTGQRTEDRQVVSVERVMTRFEHISQFAPVHEHGHLTWSYDQLSTVLDLIVEPRKSPYERVTRIVDPLDYVNQFSAEFIEQSHLGLRMQC